MCWISSRLHQFKVCFLSTSLWLVFSLSVVLLLPFSVAACPVEKPLRVTLLLPLDPEQGEVGQTFLDGVIAADEEGASLDGECEVALRYFNTQEEGRSFEEVWQQVVGEEPDLLFGPLLHETQQYLSEMDLEALPDHTRWIYPGQEGKSRVILFSIGQWARARNLLDFSWEQGENRLTLLFPHHEKWSPLIEQITGDWELRGGAVQQVRYGDRYGELSRAVAHVSEKSDWVMGMTDQSRLQMLHPLMEYHQKRQPIYSLNLPLERPARSRDLEGVRFPVQPAMADQLGDEWSADLLLREIENIGFDLMMLSRHGGIAFLEQEDSFFGKSGRYFMEQGRLLREFCVVELRQGKFSILQCPEETVEAASMVD